MYFLIKCDKFFVFNEKKIKNINNKKCLAKFKSGCFEAEIIDTSHCEKTLQLKCREFNDEHDAAQLMEQFQKVTPPNSKKVENLLDAVELTEQCHKVTRAGSSRIKALLGKCDGHRTITKKLDVAGSETSVLFANNSFVNDADASNKLSQGQEAVDVAGLQTSVLFANSTFVNDAGASNKLSQGQKAGDVAGLQTSVLFANSTFVIDAVASNKLFDDRIAVDVETGVSLVNDSTPFNENNIDVQIDNQSNDPEADSDASEKQDEPFEDSGSEYKENKTESESDTVITPSKRRSRSPFGKTRRVRWTNEERFDVTLALGDVMTINKLPSLQECNKIIKRSSSLQNRTPAQLKTWIDNQRKAAARKGTGKTIN